MQIAVRAAGLLHGTGRRSAPRHGEEEARADRARAREVRGGLPRGGSHRSPGEGAVRPDRAVRRLRVPGRARVRVRLRRVPDRVPEGAPSGRVHVGDADERQGRQGPQAVLPERVPPDGHRGPAARRERVRERLRPREGPSDREGRSDPLRTVGGPQRGGGRRRPDHRRAPRERRVRVVRRLLPEGRAVGAHEAGPGEPDLRGGVRLARVRPPRPDREPGQGVGSHPRRTQGRGRRAVLALRGRLGRHRGGRVGARRRGVRQADPAARGEGGAGPVRHRPPAPGGAGSPGRADHARDRRPRGAWATATW